MAARPRVSTAQRLSRRRCLYCGHDGPALQSSAPGRTPLACRACLGDLYARPPRTYAELEGLPPPAPSPIASRWLLHTRPLESLLAVISTACALANGLSAHCAAALPIIAATFVGLFREARPRAPKRPIGPRRHPAHRADRLDRWFRARAAGSSGDGAGC
jgi:hypothetical protein